MNFHHLAYWQDKALSLAIENRLFINGEYTAAAENETFETVDPVTQAPLAKIARGKSVDIDRAVSAARGVFERGDWSLSSPAKRKAVLNKLADLMEAHAEELALLETLDTGKPIRHSLRDDIPGAARAIRWYAEAIDKVYGEVATTSSHELAMIVREPVGVIAAIVPWNFPLLLTCWKLGPALAAGNSVVLKPSEKSPLSAIRLAGLAKRSMPCGTQVITTERLSEDLARSLIPKNYCVEDCNYLLDYYRLTADNRLLYGGGVVYGARDPDDVERLVVPKLLKTFPQLKGVKIDYRWTGNFLLTLSRMPQFGRLDTNIYYMQGYSGHGVTCTHLAGRLIAELLRGDAERFDAFANLPHYPFPGGRTLRVPFTAMGAVYYSLRDRLGV
ncbi:aldehyde dehydrogenase family protein [Escherichia coli]